MMRFTLILFLWLCDEGVVKTLEDKVMKKMMMVLVMVLGCVMNVKGQWENLFNTTNNNTTTITLQSPTTTTSTNYNLRVEINTTANLSIVEYKTNGVDSGGEVWTYEDDSRGINAVYNDKAHHYNMNEMVNLNYGNNIIEVTVGTSAGETTKSFNVYVSQNGNQTASIEKIWTESNVFQNGKKGINIHVTFTVHNMKGLDGRCIVCFYYSDKTRMPYRLPDYKTEDGYASYRRHFTPSYDDTKFNDFVIFVPYDALSSQLGYCYAQIQYPKGKQLCRTEFCSFGSSPVSYGRRVALVIGNANYQGSPLQNPVNDATDIAKKLENLGFSVTLKTNLTHYGLDNAFKSFQTQANGSDVALVYYAGHGMEDQGITYLIPTDAPLYDVDKVKYESANANYMLEMISGAKKKIVILDACRNLPGRGIMHSGIGVLSATNTFFAYSTSPGKTAPDGIGRNSPYTAALLSVLNEKNLTLPQLFQKVSQIVTKNSSQVPWTSSSLVDDIILNR